MSCNCKSQHETCCSKEKDQDKVEVHIHIDCCKEQCNCRKPKRCPDVKVIY